MGGETVGISTQFDIKIRDAAHAARSRWKTGAPAKEGDEDLVDYYYLVIAPNGLKANEIKNKKRKELPAIRTRLEARFLPGPTKLRDALLAQDPFGREIGG
eukprot:9704-Prymnesium_polylepis.1